MKNEKTDIKNSAHLLVSFSLLLIGAVMIAEAAIILTVLQQITPFLTQNSATIAWGYTLLKILAGVVAIAAGGLIFLKRR